MAILSRRVLYWGWLRMLLGSIQMAGAVCSVIFIIREGPQQLATWIAIGGTLAAGALSRLLFRGRRDPALRDTPASADTDRRKH